MLYYYGTITAQVDDWHHLINLGLKLGDYDESKHEYKVLSCPEESLKLLDQYSSIHHWSLFPSNGFEQAENKVEWFIGILKPGVSMRMRLPNHSPDWATVSYISQANRFFVLEKYQGMGQNALVEFSTIKFVPEVKPHPGLDRFCFNGWLWVNASEIVIP